MDGEGTEWDPYIVQTFEDLTDVKGDLSGYYVQTSYIDAEGKEWNPIAENSHDDYVFSGTYDGNGHAIKNLSTNRDGEWHNKEGLGLFGCCQHGAVLKNIVLENPSIITDMDDWDSSNLGHLVGAFECEEDDPGVIENCIVTGGYVHGYSQIGSLVGTASAVDIKDCTVEDCVNSASDLAGGIIGYADFDVHVSNCHAEVSFTDVTWGFVGGIIGSMVEHTSIEDCTADVFFSTDVEDSLQLIGAIAGENYGPISNCTATLTLEAFQDLSEIGAIAGVNYDPGVLTDCKGTINLTDEVGELLNIGGVTGYNYNEIKNCKSYGEITMGDGSEIGGFVGITEYKIEDCESFVDINSNAYFSGGFVGDARADIENCSAEGNIKGFYAVGGFVGLNRNTTKLCYAKGNVTTTNGYAGGFVGYLTGGDTIRCWAEGDVEDDSDQSYIGGFIGFSTNVSSINNCYAVGSVTAEEGDSVAGFIGRAYNVDINNCYSKGFVTGADRVGGFNGSVGSDVTYSRNYYDYQTSGQGTEQEEENIAEPRTTEEMTKPYNADTTYIDWDFVNIWYIFSYTNEGYPVLQFIEDARKLLFRGRYWKN